MKKLATVVLGLCSANAMAQESHQVRGYVRRDGVYVAPHMQTNADSSPYNNWTSRPNVNPYTGREGTVNPQPAPQPVQPFSAGRPRTKSIFGY